MKQRYFLVVLSSMIALLSTTCRDPEACPTDTSKASAQPTAKIQPQAEKPRTALSQPRPMDPRRAQELAIWRQFVVLLRSDRFTADKIRPHHESLRQPILGFLKKMSQATHQQSRWQEWEAIPEIVRGADGRLHFIAKLNIESPNFTYLFSFVCEGKEWYFQHLEGIHIRLDKLGSLPCSEFPDLSATMKSHMRIEGRATKQVRLFKLLSKEKGRKFAFDWFKDGWGFLMAAKTWVPFFTPAKAFILYACWEQARLQGNTVTLEKLDDQEAVVALDSWFLEIYERASHLKQQISKADYRGIFEAVWLDRAAKAGWHLEITYGKLGKCRMRFAKKPLVRPKQPSLK